MFVTDATHLPQLMQCFGSSQMPHPIPNDDGDTTARDEGNAAHHIAQQVFGGKTTLESLAGTRAYNNVVIDADMIHHVGEYLGNLDCGEMEVFTSFGNDRWQINARADHICYRAETSTLTIDDFKYGYRLVQPEMNWTLVAHAIGYCLLHQITPQRIVLRIHQPRRHHPDGTLREWPLTYVELRDLYVQIDRHLTEADTILRTGPACVTCDSASVCPAWRDASMNAIDATSAHYSDEMSLEALSRELDLLTHAENVISERLKALTELALHRSRGGEVIPMYAGETQYANRRFKFDADAIRAMTGVEPTIPKLITPAELERRGVPKEIMTLLTERPITGVKLIRSDPNKRAERLLKKGKS